jgi:hypothetical protein
MEIIMSFKKHEPTQEQKEAAAAKRAAFKELCKRIADMSDEQRAAMADKMGAVVTVEGHALSGTNTLLVLYQYSTPTIVGGFQQWKKNGRKVKKGEHGLSIWIPKTEKADPNKQPGEMSLKDLDVHFFMGYVFDIGQTEPMDAPERNSAGAVITPGLCEEWNKMQDFISQPA